MKIRATQHEKSFIFSMQIVHNINANLKVSHESVRFKMLYLAMMDATKKMDRQILRLGTDTGAAMYILR